MKAEPEAQPKPSTPPPLNKINNNPTDLLGSGKMLFSTGVPDRPGTIFVRPYEDFDPLTFMQQFCIASTFEVSQPHAVFVAPPEALTAAYSIVHENKVYDHKDLSNLVHPTTVIKMLGVQPMHLILLGTLMLGSLTDKQKMYLEQCLWQTNTQVEVGEFVFEPDVSLEEVLTTCLVLNLSQEQRVYLKTVNLTVTDKDGRVVFQ